MDIPKEHLKLFTKALNERLPRWFALHSKLLEVADPETGELRCSLKDLGKLTDLHPHVVIGVLLSLNEIGVIEFDCPHDIHQKVKIKVIL